MPKVTITKGLPASGKSTWAKEQVKRSQGKTKRVNKDDLRAMLDVSTYSSNNERFILQIRDKIILAALRAGKNVIIDDTNLHPKHERKIRDLVGPKVAVEVMFFDVDVDECIRRDAEREGIAQVGEEVIRRMAKEWESWKHLDTSVEYSEPDIVEPIPGLEWVILCDLDGTLAHGIGDHRTAYEWKKCIDDTVDGAVLEVLQAMHESGWKIVYMSGRDAVCREETDAWLEIHEAPPGPLFMRPEGDQRKDSIVKRELFDAHIRGKYNVLFVLDDRNQVVDEWRMMGLKVLQVAEGDF